MNLTAIQGNIVSMRGNLLAMDARQPFIIEVDTSKGNGFNTFTLPLSYSTTDIYVKTSDGQRFTVTSYIDAKRIINFASAGVYTIELRGQCGWSFNGTGDCQKLTKIISWGDFQFNYLSGGFYGCINIGLNGGLPTNGSINAPTITSLTNTFSTCSLNSINADIFNLCGNVTNFYQTFYNNGLTSIPSGLFDNCPNVTNFTLTFYSNQLTSIPSGLFDNNTLVTNFQYTFYNNRLTSIPSGLFDNCPNVTSFYEAFYSNQLTSIPSGLFDNCPNVTNFNGTFYNNRLTSIPSGLFDNCPNVTSFTQTFQQNLITSIPENLFINCHLVTNYASTFQYALSNNCVIPLVMFDLTKLSIVTSFNTLFNQPSIANSPIGTVQDIWNYASPTATKTDCFQNCTGLANYASIPVDWI